MTKNESEGDTGIDFLNLHHGRLRTLLQALKDHDAEIKLKLDSTVKTKQNTFGYTGAEYGLLELLKTV